MDMIECEDGHFYTREKQSSNMNVYYRCNQYSSSSYSCKSRATVLPNNLFIATLSREQHSHKVIPFTKKLLEESPSVMPIEEVILDHSMIDEEVKLEPTEILDVYDQCL